MFTTREQTMIAKVAATAVALGVPVVLVLSDGINVTKEP